MTTRDEAATLEWMQEWKKKKSYLKKLSEIDFLKYCQMDDTNTK